MRIYNREHPGSGPLPNIPYVIQRKGKKEKLELTMASISLAPLKNKNAPSKQRLEKRNLISVVFFQ